MLFTIVFEGHTGCPNTFPARNMLAFVVCAHCLLQKYHLGWLKLITAVLWAKSTCKMLEESQCLPWLQNRASATALHYLQMYDRMLGWGHKGPVSLRREKTKFVEEWERTIHTSHLCNSTDRSSLCVPLSFVTLCWYPTDRSSLCVPLSFVTLFMLVANRQIIFVCTSLLCNSVRVGSQPTDHLCVYLSPL